MAIKYVEEPLPAVEIIDFKIQGWYGLNKNNGNFRTGELKSCRNMTGEYFPYAAPRKPREVIQSGIINPQKLFFNDDKMGYIADGKFYYDGEEKGVCGDTKSVVVYDNKIISFPSAKHYDVETDVISDLFEETKLSLLEENHFISKDNHAYMLMICKTDSNDEYLFTCEGKETLELSVYGLLADKIYVVFYNSSGASIKGNTETYYKFIDYGEKISFKIPEGAVSAAVRFAYQTRSNDGVTTERTREDIADAETDLAKTPTKDYLIVQTDAVPVSEYACEFNNRIVGVAKDDIHCSSLGDFRSWNNYDEETGSYATDVGTLGDFTGIINFQGMVYMFKPDVVHQLYGTGLPFYVSEAFKTGCVDGKTICEVNSTLYWLGREGVYAYSGGMPRLISQDVFEGYRNGTACTDGRNYYICLNDGTNYETFIYDTYTGLWHRYDETPYVDLACSEGCVYGLTAGGNIIKFASGNERVNWSFETHDMNFGMNQRKNVSKVWVRVDMKPNTILDVYVSNNGGEYKRVAQYTAENETMFDFKVRIKKTDSFSFKFEGVGDVRILDIHAKVKIGTTKHRVGDDLDVYR